MALLLVAYDLGVGERSNERDPADRIANQRWQDETAQHFRPRTVSVQPQVERFRRASDDMREMREADHIVNDDYNPNARGLRSGE